MKRFASGALHVDSTLVTTINQPEERDEEEKVISVNDDGNETITVNTYQVPVSMEDLVQQSLAPIGEFLHSACMGMEAKTKDDQLPFWQLEAWLQRVLTETYRQASSNVHLEAEWLLQSSSWVVVDEHVAAHWETMAKWLQKAKEIAAKAQPGLAYGSYLEALEILEDTQDYLDALRKDPALMEPLRFSSPQFMAIFAPLCLPLFLPHLIGLIREYKRYKKAQGGYELQMIE